MIKATAMMLSAIVMFSAATMNSSDAGLLEPTKQTAAVQSAAQAKNVGRTAAATGKLDLTVSPLRGAKTVAQLSAGDRVEIIRELDVGSTRWVYVRSDSRSVVGCAPLSSLRLLSDEEVVPANAPRGIVTTNQLNIRSAPGVNNPQVGTYSLGSRVAILETNGEWGRTVKGWVYMGYIYMEGTIGKYPTLGIVTTAQLNVRSGPGTGFSAVGTLSSGDGVVILEQVNTGAGIWGYTGNGWVSMNYIGDGGLPSFGEPIRCYGIVTSPQLNVRTDAGTAYPVVAQYRWASIVYILEYKEVGGVLWGRAPDGWVCMSYITVIEIFDVPETPTEPEETEPEETTPEETEPEETEPEETVPEETEPEETVPEVPTWPSHGDILTPEVPEAPAPEVPEAE